jgi:hypothetical protein
MNVVEFSQANAVFEVTSGFSVDAMHSMLLEDGIRFRLPTDVGFLAALTREISARI